jgi:hypothetical protein
MTNLPEARLAREAELCYATLALPTDYDCWRAHDEEVRVADVLSVRVRPLDGRSCSAAWRPALFGSLVA